MRSGRGVGRGTHVPRLNFTNSYVVISQELLLENRLKTATKLVVNSVIFHVTFCTITDHY